MLFVGGEVDDDLFVGCARPIKRPTPASEVHRSRPNIERANPRASGEELLDDPPVDVGEAIVSASSLDLICTNVVVGQTEAKAR